jgi:tetratricopeptide (TPR) repeat protein
MTKPATRAGKRLIAWRTVASGLGEGRWTPLALFVLALVPRLVFWLEWNRAGLLALPVVDAHTFDQEARGLLTGAWPGPQVFWQAPFYSLFLGGIYALAGPSWPVARLANALVGAATCVLAWRLARRWLSPRGSLAAFGICALYGPLIYFEGQLLRETLATFLLVGCVLAILRARDSGRPLAWGLAGLLLGAAAICRENALILLPAALAAELVAPRDRPARWPRRAANPAALLLGTALAIAPVAVHNLARGEGGFVPISSSGGINFYLGNNPNSRETVAIRPGRFWEELVSRPRREAGAVTPAARSAFFLREATRWIASEPAAFALNTLRKGVGLFAAHEVKRNQDIYEARQGSVVLRLLLWRAGPLGFPFGLLGPLALLGLLLALRARGSPGALAWIALTYALGIVLFFPNARYRLPLVPILAVLAAWALARLASPAPGRARAGLVLVDGGWVRAVDDPADQAFLRGNALAQMGRTPEALAELQRASRLNPRHGEALTTLAALYGSAGRREESLAAARAALAIDSTDAQAWVNVGTVLLDGGDPQAAEPVLRRALDAQPDLASGWVNLGCVQVELGDPAGAEESFRRALTLDPDQADAYRNLAQQLGKAGRLDEARAVLRRGTQRLPGEGPLWLALGTLEGRAGRWDDAIRALERAVKCLPNSADAWNNLGVVLAQRGRIEPALGAFRRALAIDPSHPQAPGNLRRYGR